MFCLRVLDPLFVQALSGGRCFGPGNSHNRNSTPPSYHVNPCVFLSALLTPLPFLRILWRGERVL